MAVGLRVGAIRGQDLSPDPSARSTCPAAYSRRARLLRAYGVLESCGPRAPRTWHGLLEQRARQLGPAALAVEAAEAVERDERVAAGVAQQHAGARARCRQQPRSACASRRCASAARCSCAACRPCRSSRRASVAQQQRAVLGQEVGVLAGRTQHCGRLVQPALVQQELSQRVRGQHGVRAGAGRRRDAGSRRGTGAGGPRPRPGGRCPWRAAELAHRRERLEALGAVDRGELGQRACCADAAAAPTRR